MKLPILTYSQILLVLIIGGLLGGLIYGLNRVNPAPPVVSEKPISIEEQIEEKMKELIEDQERRSQIRDCFVKTLTKEEARDCLKKINISKKDLVVCDIPILEGKNQYYEYDCIAIIAAATENQSFCELAKKYEVDWYRDFCYVELAAIKQDVAICEKIESEGAKETCYKEIAEVKRDAAICEKIKSSTPKFSCYKDVAQLTHNVVICEKIKNQIWKHCCYDENRNYLSITSSDCQTVQIKTEREGDHCYQLLALMQEDSTICEKIKDQSLKEVCYIVLAAAKNDQNLCQKVQIKKDFCYQRVGILKGELAICEKIQDRALKEVCYIAVAAKKEDSAICEKIEDLTYKNWCYSAAEYYKATSPFLKIRIPEKIVYKEPFTFDVIIRNLRKSGQNFSVKLNAHNYFATIESLNKESDILELGKEYTFSWRLIPNQTGNLRVDITVVPSPRTILDTVSRPVYISVLQVYPAKQTPEEVANQFLNWYFNYDYNNTLEETLHALEERDDLTEEYKQKIISIKEQEGFISDFEICSWGVPPDDLKIEKAVISGAAASLIVQRDISALRIDFLLIDNQWKINNIRCAAVLRRNITKCGIFMVE